MGTTWFEQGEEKGIAKGQRRLLQRQLEKRFGPLNSAVVARLESLTEEQLNDIGLRLIDAPRSLDELGLGGDKPA